MTDGLDNWRRTYMGGPWGWKPCAALFVVMVVHWMLNHG